MAVSTLLTSYLDSLTTRTQEHAAGKANEKITVRFITDLAKNIAAHFQSPLNNGTKKPKKKFVHEKPIGACLSW